MNDTDKLQEVAEAAKAYLKSRGLKNPPIDSGIGGAVDLPRTYVADAMAAYALSISETQPGKELESTKNTQNGHKLLEEITDKALSALGFNKSVIGHTYFFHKDIVEINLKLYGKTYWVRFRDQDVRPVKGIADLKSIVFAMTGKNLK